MVAAGQKSRSTNQLAGAGLIQFRRQSGLRSPRK